MDRQPLRVRTVNNSGYRQTTTLGSGKTTIHHMNSRKLTGYGQTTTQDIDRKPPRIWTDNHSGYGQTANQKIGRPPFHIWTSNHTGNGQTTT